MHWRLADGTGVEVLNWLDDHSRYLLSATVHTPVSGEDVVAVFLDLVEQQGPPVATLTDNGSVYMSRFTGGRNAFEYLLALLGIRQKNGSPGHPQTQGKSERFHQTCSAGSTPDRSLPAARNCNANSTSSATTTTSSAPTARWAATHQPTPTARPPKQLPPARPRAQQHYRLRYDRLDAKGKMSLRRAGRMHHLGIGAAHARKRVLGVLRRAPRHRRGPHHRRGPLRPPHSARQELLAQPKQRARPMAGLSKPRLMTRLIRDTCPDSSQAREEGFEPPTSSSGGRRSIH